MEASTWASGSQEAKGKTGNFIKNEKVNKKNATFKEWLLNKIASESKENEKLFKL